MDDKVWALIGLVACGLVWAGMALGHTRLRRWQARLLALWQGLRRRLHRPAQARDAKREAAEAIERARRSRPRVDREGNVYRPDSFGGRRSDRDKLH